MVTQVGKCQSDAGTQAGSDLLCSALGAGPGQIWALEPGFPLGSRPLLLLQDRTVRDAIKPCRLALGENTRRMHDKSQPHPRVPPPQQGKSSRTSGKCILPWLPSRQG